MSKIISVPTNAEMDILKINCNLSEDVKEGLLRLNDVDSYIKDEVAKAITESVDFIYSGREDQDAPKKYIITLVEVVVPHLVGESMEDIHTMICGFLQGEVLTEYINKVNESGYQIKEAFLVQIKCIVDDTYEYYIRYSLLINQDDFPRIYIFDADI